MSASTRIRRGFNRIAFVFLTGFCIAAIVALTMQILNPSGAIYADIDIVKDTPGSVFQFHKIAESEQAAAYELQKRHSTTSFRFNDGRLFSAASIIDAPLQPSDFDDIRKSVITWEAANLQTVASFDSYAMNSIAFSCQENCYSVEGRGSHLARSLSLEMPIFLGLAGLIIAATFLLLSYFIRGFLL